MTTYKIPAGSPLLPLVRELRDALGNCISKFTEYEYRRFMACSEHFLRIAIAQADAALAESREVKP